MQTDALELLLRTEAFGGLPREELESLAARLSLVTFPAGTQIAVQGRTTLACVYIIRSGRLELFFENRGERRLKGGLGPGDVFGAISILMNAGLSVRTLNVDMEASAYALPKNEFLDLCGRFKALHEHFSRDFNERMRDESYAAAIAASQVTHFLTKIPPFSFLPEDDIQRAAAAVTSVFFARDTVVLTQGESRVDGLYILHKGAAERYFEEDNRKSLHGALAEGEAFGGISMLVNDMLAVRTLRTIEDTQFFKLPHQEFFDLCRRHEAFSEFFTDAFGKRMLDRSYAAVIAKSASCRIESLPLLNRPVTDICSRDLVACGGDLSIQEAAGLMSRRGCSSIFVRGAGGDIVGVATDNDLRTKVISTGLSVRRPVADIMSSPLKSIPEGALVSEALVEMMQHNIKHLAVTDASRKVIGVMTNQDVMAAQGQSPFFLLREISVATGEQAIAKHHGRLPQMVQSLISAGTPAVHINRFVTAISDAVLKKVMEFSLGALGTPPVPFAFLILGSEGRREQTLKTDQDNAIVYTDVGPADADHVRDYFLKLGETVCTRLNQCGYQFCEANVMARNPKLCQPLGVWRNYFSEWIHAAEAEDLLYSSIFFDFRCGWGEMDLVRRLREHLLASLEGWSGFFRHMAQNALRSKPPLGFFRNFVVESKGEHRNKFDIKHAMMPVVDFTRIYALKHGLEETNTLGRLNLIKQKEVLPAKECSDIEQGYSFLMQLRFARQVTAAIEEGRAPDNFINPKELSGIEQRLLKEIFIRIGSLQTRLSFEFTGEP